MTEIDFLAFIDANVDAIDLDIDDEFCAVFAADVKRTAVSEATKNGQTDWEFAIERAEYYIEEPLDLALALRFEDPIYHPTLH
jgi:hypothetical protein